MTNSASDQKKYQYYAFFDVDGTIINGKSMFGFLMFYYRNYLGFYNPFAFLQYALACFRCGFWSFRKQPREYINREYYKIYTGHRVDKVHFYGKKWFDKKLKNRTFFKRSTLREIRWHRDRGAAIVLVSGSFPACLSPIANYVEADFILSANIEEKQGKYTGNLIPPQTIGKGKLAAIRQLMERNSEVEYRHCYAYGDHISDLPMLEMVGNKVVVSGDESLESHAKEKGWRVLA